MAKLQGGTRIYGNLFVDAGLSAGNLYLANTTPATSTTTGALVVAGGASFGKDIWVAGNVYAANITSITYGYLQLNDPLVYLTSNVTYPYNYSIGFYSQFTGGPANVYAHTGLTRNWTDNRWYLFSNVGEPQGGNVNISDTNLLYDAIVTGDHYTYGNITTYGNIKTFGNITTTNDVISYGNVISAGNITVQGILYANSAAVSTDSTTGAFKSAGGVGIGGNLSVGGNARIISDSGHILVGDKIRDANINNVWVQGVGSGATGDRPFNLIDTSSVVKVVRANDSNPPAVEFQSWTANLAIRYAWWDMFAGPANPADVSAGNTNNFVIRDRSSSINVLGTAGVKFVVDSAGNTKVAGNYTYSTGEAVGATYTIDDISSQFDGTQRSFTIRINDGTIYSVNNPNQLSLQIGGVSIAPTRYIVDYQNLTEITTFTRGFYLQTGNVAANASVITGNNYSTGGNVITFATAPTQGMSFYGTVRTNLDNLPPFTFKQSPFTALNIMLGS